jgi:hypothetical protein
MFRHKFQVPGMGKVGDVHLIFTDENLDVDRLNIQRNWTTKDIKVFSREKMQGKYNSTTYADLYWIGKELWY